MPGVVQQYVEAKQEYEDSEFQSEARSLREEIHIDQFHARYESPDENASEYQQNLHADESVDFVERQLRAADRQFPDATEVEKLQMTESKLGLGHSRSGRLITDYGRYAQRENESPSFREAFKSTTERLRERYGEGRTQWSSPDERQFVEEIATGERHSIAMAAHEMPGSRYAVDQSYTKGAWDAIAAFRDEHMQRLAETESPRESIRMRAG
jgi:hypothetical protein